MVLGYEDYEKTFRRAREKGDKIVIVTGKTFGTFVELHLETMKANAEKYGYKLVDLTTNPSTYLFNPCIQVVAKFQLETARALSKFKPTSKDRRIEEMRKRSDWYTVEEEEDGKKVHADTG